jgi:hypothetical protein
VSGIIVAGGVVSNPTDVLWLRCPSCDDGIVKARDGVLHPAVMPCAEVQGLPLDVEQAWKESRLAYSAAAYTASEIMCRKILMHIAVDVAQSQQGKKFIEYINDLESAGHIATGLKPVVDSLRGRGNIANHELPASTRQQATVTLSIAEHLLRGIYELPTLVP